MTVVSCRPDGTGLRRGWDPFVLDGDGSGMRDRDDCLFERARS